MCLIAAMTCSLPVVGVAGAITIQNAGFEDGPPTNTTMDDVPNWDPAPGTVAADARTKTDGSQAAVGSALAVLDQNGGMYQLTSHAIEADMHYALRFQAHYNNSSNPLEIVFSYDNAGTPTTIKSKTISLTGSYRAYALTFYAESGAPYIGQSLGIQFKHAGSNSSALRLDDVELENRSLVNDRPNIVYMMIDDLGWGDVSTGLTNQGNSSSFFETPHLDTLASEGQAYDSAYTCGPNCAPTRAALLTGQWAQRPNNNVFLVDSLNRGGNSTMLVGPSQGLSGSGNDEIPGSAVTIAETLNTAGYVSAHFGKYHSGGERQGDNDPISQGFDYNYGGQSDGGPGNYFTNSSDIFGGRIGPELDPFAADYTQQYVDNFIKPYAVNINSSLLDALVGTNKHVTDAMTDAAIEFMEENKNHAFYMQFHDYAVHTPVGNSQARPDLLTKYQGKTPVDDDGDGNESNSFAALVEGFDQGIGRIIDYLKTTDDPNNPGSKLSDNTIFIFASDNGGRENQSYNGTLKGQKGELDEGGIRIPMVVWSTNPGLVDGGKIISEPVYSVDFFQTYVELANASTTGMTLDGESMVKLFNGTTTQMNREYLYWHVPGYLIDSRNLRPRSVIRNDNWKLNYNYETLSFELFSMDTDIQETTDVANLNPAVVLEMGTALMNWLNDTDAPLATLRNNQSDVEVTVDGFAYQNGTITEYTGQTLTVTSGQEVPFVIQRDGDSGNFVPFGKQLTFQLVGNDEYVSADTGLDASAPLGATAATVGSMETFEMTLAGSGSTLVNLRDLNTGNYVFVDTTQSGNPLLANQASASNASDFVWTNVGEGIVRLTASTNNQNVRADLNLTNNPLQANTTGTGTWTQYRWMIVGDEIAPGAPTNLNASNNAGAVTLSWDAASGYDVVGYNIYRSTQSGTGYLLVAGNVTELTSLDNLPTEGGPFYYVVTALDNFDNESDFSNEIIIQTAPNGATIWTVY